jgi:hypothetical protein
LNLSYSRVWTKGSVVVRAGQISTAFGTFSQRYEDSVNPLVGMPMEYGYDGGVSIAGITGAQTALTWGNWDGRVQVSNSSPLNPRSTFDKDQHPNWAGGLGFTIRQGLRVGASAFRGPYLDKGGANLFPVGSTPSGFPASAVGLDLEWASGHWNLNAELQRFEFNYPVNPTFRQDAGYVEVKRVLHPRLYVAARAGFLHGTSGVGGETYEFTAGFRPDSRQVIKFGYSFDRDTASGAITPLYAIQLVTMIHPFSIAWP